MSTNLKGIAARYASALKASEIFTSDPEDRPTATDIWLWKLEDAVWSNVQYPGRASGEEGYDHFKLYAHHDCLKSQEDIYNASNDVLLEALGLGNAESWGWLRFMVRELNWFALLASNWGLPGLLCEYGGNRDVVGCAEENERRAQAALYFIDLMRERGIDPLVDTKSRVEKFKTMLREQNVEIGEDELIQWLKDNCQWVYFVYTCESVVIRSGPADEIAYKGDFRAQFRSRIRAAAERRRQNWNKERTCDCEPANQF